MDALHHVIPPAPATARAGVTSPFKLRPTPSGQGVFACQPIARGTALFGEDDWADEDERRSFSTLSAQQLGNLTPLMRAAFLRFAYNIAPDRISGSFRPEAVRHPVNFINHSCEPNAGYDGADHIVALRRIAPGEEI